MDRDFGGSAAPTWPTNLDVGSFGESLGSFETLTAPMHCDFGSSEALTMQIDRDLGSFAELLEALRLCQG